MSDITKPESKQLFTTRKLHSIHKQSRDPPLTIKKIYTVQQPTIDHQKALTSELISKL